MKTRNFQLTSIEKRPSVRFTQTSKVLYLNHIKLVLLSHYYFDFSVGALILSNFIMRLINWKVRKKTAIDQCIKELLDKIQAP